MFKNQQTCVFPPIVSKVLDLDNEPAQGKHEKHDPKMFDTEKAYNS